MGDGQGSDGRKSLRGVVAGAIAGAVASFAMDRFQAAVGALTTDDDREQPEPATEQAADAIARRVSGHEFTARTSRSPGRASITRSGSDWVSLTASSRSFARQ